MTGRTYVANQLNVGEIMTSKYVIVIGAGASELHTSDLWIK